MGRKKDKQKLNRGGSKGQNSKNSEDFLKINSQKEDVITMESGLQYKIIKTSEGNFPDEFDTVVVNQRTLLIDGKVIDDTYKTGKTFEVNLQEALEGYREGLQLMSVGSRYKFFIPSELAWGKKGSGGRIGPNAVLIFDVKLEEIK